MMLFDWFDGREATRFGLTLANYFAERLTCAESGNRKKTHKKQTETLTALFAQAARFRTAHKLNMYKKAKLANAFKWSLVDRGYDPGFVDEITRELLLHL